MSALAHSYSEPYKLPAGVLALTVHGLFFALIYFGINWRAEPPQGMVVDIWDSLPQAETVQAVTPPPPAAVEPPKPVEPPRVVEPPKPVEARKQAEPEPLPVPPKAVIELAEKTKSRIRQAELKKQEEIKKQAEQKRLDAERAAQAEQAAKAEQERGRIRAEQAAQAERERVRAEQAAAIGKVVDEHKARIIAKIRRNIVMPPDVPDDARAEFEVTLLPGGSVLSAKLTRPSGREAYDDAVERAIFKAQPLPLPPDVALFNKFREMRLVFKPIE
jgi:colicin import membrane protein